MMKKTKAVFMASVMAVMFLSGCQSKSVSNGRVNIYYAAIESGDYYEGWADQLKEQAQKQGADFEVGYAEKSIDQVCRRGQQCNFMRAGFCGYRLRAESSCQRYADCIYQ